MFPNSLARLRATNTGTLLDQDAGMTSMPTGSMNGVFAHEWVTDPERIPARDDRFVDVAILDMNHGWPNVGHDAIVHSIHDMADGYREQLHEAGLHVRVLSFDVRRTLIIPDLPGGRFSIYLGTGGPGHLDPRENDGSSEGTQGILENPGWEAPLFRLYDAIEESADASMFAVCHTFGILCRWKKIAAPVLRGSEKGGKSTGVVENVLTPDAVQHPLYRQFSEALPDGKHFRVMDNRLYDLIPQGEFPAGVTPLSYEATGKGGPAGDALTMIEIARDREGVMPRFTGVNHHPEILDRSFIMSVLEEKRERGEVSTQWFEERAHAIEASMRADYDFFIRLTSSFTFLLPIEFQLVRQIRQRREMLGFEAGMDERQLIP